MRKNPLRTTALAATALAGVLSLSACGKGGTDAAAAPSPSASAPSSTGASHDANQGREADGGTGGGAKSSKSPGTPAAARGGNSTGGSGGTGHTGGSGGKASGTGGSGGKGGYGQVCGANDLSWTAKSETQAGGYILISVKAKPGITCTLPGVHPVVAFGSDGTEAGPAEQAVTEQVKLSGGTVAYAGLNPKTTNTEGGKELNDVTVSVEEGDRTDPVGLTTGSITVDRPIVTNWHTSPQKAVPGDGLDSH
ncbi:DUF4232 domain-containing protein [Streptomyces sp. NPDC051162]|uniref:DUF4232 domain-containing protein n=1 Tax=Streptomyces sp. NPDC051162 TaxID=3154747 RepID=UPI00343646D8